MDIVPCIIGVMGYYIFMHYSKLLTVSIQLDDEMEMENLRGSEHEPEPKEFEVGVRIKNLTKIYDKVLTKSIHIRASVDALCRDGTSEISRDPRTKCLQTRRESLAMPSKHSNNNF